MTAQIRCHYEVLGIERDADAATIKKAHRKLALKLHPDKNIGDDSAAEQFRLVQQAYECLSDATERKWYDEHREAILRGWSANDGNHDLDILFDVVPYMHAGCFRGFGNDDDGEGQDDALVWVARPTSRSSRADDLSRQDPRRRATLGWQRSIDLQSSSSNGSFGFDSRNCL